MNQITSAVKTALHFFWHQLSRLPLVVRIILIVVIVGAGSYTGYHAFASTKQETQYETATAETGTLITSVSGSGTITSGNSTSITSKASGIVKSVLVTNGDTVTKGQKIAEVTLDDYGQARQTSAWASYLDAQEAVKTAQKNKVTADIQMWQARGAIETAEDDIEYKNEHTINPDTKEDYTDSEKVVIDKSLEQAHLAFEEAELKYKDADSEIQLAQAQVTAALRDYQENSSTIYAPADGTVSNLSLATGMVISSSSSSNSNATANSISGVSSQTFGKVDNTDGSLQATISLSEIDIITVKANQKVTLTLDAYDDKTFTGKVLAVDTDGTSNSGVTSYSVTIVLDPTDIAIYPNMAVTADIITNLKTDILLIPTTTIQTSGDTSTVDILKDGQVSTVTVETGDSNDSQTEITSGLSAGDVVITSVITATSTKTSDDSSTTSPFSGLSSGSSSKSGGSSGGPPAGGPPGGF